LKSQTFKQRFIFCAAVKIKLQRAGVSKSY